MRRSILRLLGILAILFMFLTFSTPASAHPPIGMDLVYSEGVLEVTIYHLVAEPDTFGHYIETVQIYVNDGLEYEETYTTQPAAVASFTYLYSNITAYPGDTIEVIATCSVTGSANESMVVPSGQLPLDVDIDTSSSEVEAGNDIGVTVTVTSQGTSVEDVDLLASSDPSGSFTDFEDKGNGEYTATYTAPEVTTDTTVTITVKASKVNYDHAEETAEITVTAASGGGGSSGDDDDGLPGFEIAGLLAGLVAVALVVAIRKRNRQ